MRKHTLLLLTCWFFTAANAQELTQTPFKAGSHYDLITPAWETASAVPVVYEFFSYMCPGCNAFEPIMNQLDVALGEEPEIIRVPVAFYPQWKPHAKAYHAFKLMGVLEQVHGSLFAAIHQQKKPLRTLDDIANWAASTHDIEAQKFLQMAGSFAVDSQLRKDQQMMTAMTVSTVPTLVVNGRYKPNFDGLKTADNIIAATVELAHKK